MKKKLAIGGIIIVLLVIAFIFIRVKTKSHSPEETVRFKDGTLKIDVYYNRPYKKGREIFGKLVPFGKTWRTGANETTTFETNQDLTFGNNILKAGKYSLWSVPGEKTWQVIFNSEIPYWGVNFDGEAQRNTPADVLIQEVPVVRHDKMFEQFTISVEKVAEGAELVFIWDKTLVVVPFTVK
ncbi:MAG: DUF2911 domain-containing protein [Bacteroidetes bacterium]|nr:DUF2911 domain-containing protein [Bacteroidota bacterium]